MQPGSGGGGGNRDLARAVRRLERRIADVRPVNQTINTRAIDPHEVARLASRELAWELAWL